MFRYFLAFSLSLLGQSVDYNGEESVGGVELEEVHRVVERVGGPGVQFNTIKDVTKTVTKIILKVQFEKEICINY